MVIFLSSQIANIDKIQAIRTIEIGIFTENLKHYCETLNMFFIGTNLTFLFNSLLNHLYLLFLHFSSAYAQPHFFEVRTFHTKYSRACFECSRNEGNLVFLTSRCRVLNRQTETAITISRSTRKTNTIIISRIRYFLLYSVYFYCICFLVDLLCLIQIFQLILVCFVPLLSTIGGFCAQQPVVCTKL